MWCRRFFLTAVILQPTEIHQQQLHLSFAAGLRPFQVSFLWQVDLLVVKFVQITRHSWQTVSVSERPSGFLNVDLPGRDLAISSLITHYLLNYPTILNTDPTWEHKKKKEKKKKTRGIEFFFLSCWLIGVNKCRMWQKVIQVTCYFACQLQLKWKFTTEVKLSHIWNSPSCMV